MILFSGIFCLYWIEMAAERETGNVYYNVKNKKGDLKYHFQHKVQHYGYVHLGYSLYGNLTVNVHI